MSKQKAQELFRKVPDFKHCIRHCEENYLMDCIAEIINSLPETPPSYVTDFRVITEKDALKLRIMRAMEDMTRQNSSLQFVYAPTCDTWHCKTAFGTQQMNDYYCPKE